MFLSIAQSLGLAPPHPVLMPTHCEPRGACLTALCLFVNLCLRRLLYGRVTRELKESPNAKSSDCAWLDSENCVLCSEILGSSRGCFTGKYIHSPFTPLVGAFSKQPQAPEMINSLLKGPGPHIGVAFILSLLAWL